MSDSTNAAAQYAPLQLTRVFDAPRELVFKAFTEPERLAQWWGPKHFDNPRCEFDAQPGGAIHIDMHAEGFGTFPMGGTVHEINPPERLVFTSRAFGDDQQGWGLEVHNTLTFVEQQGKTVLTLLAVIRKAGPEAAGGLSGMEQGWKQSLLKLENLLAGEPVEFDDLQITTPGETEIHISRTFKVEPAALYKALTTPELVQQWWGGGAMMKMTHCEMDVRVGGQWRFVLAMPDGQEHGFHGEYLELVPAERIVQTFVYEPIPGAESVETAVLERVAGGTRLSVQVSHKSRENRDGHYQSGMEHGLRQSYDALETLLAERKAASLVA